MDGQRDDHDLLLQIAADVRTIASVQQAQAERIARLEAWRADHTAVSAVQISRIDGLSHGDTSHDHDIDALELWRAEMRGAWAGVKFGLTAVGAMSGLSVILEILRLVGALH